MTKAPFQAHFLTSLGPKKPCQVNPTRRSPKGFNQGGDTQSSVADIEAIPVGQGGVIKRGKQKLAVWKDMNGKPHALSASCTHLGCTVTWNNAERT
jgi:Rieske Fe-S protein